MTRRKREVVVSLRVNYIDGKSEHHLVVEDTIEQVYRQLNFITKCGNAIAINLASTRSVEIASDKITFSDINRTLDHE